MKESGHSFSSSLGLTPLETIWRPMREMGTAFLPTLHAILLSSPLYEQYRQPMKENGHSLSSSSWVVGGGGGGGVHLRYLPLKAFPALAPTQVPPPLPTPGHLPEVSSFLCLQQDP